MAKMIILKPGYSVINTRTGEVIMRRPLPPAGKDRNKFEKGEDDEFITDDDYGLPATDPRLKGQLHKFFDPDFKKKGTKGPKSRPTTEMLMRDGDNIQTRRRAAAAGVAVKHSPEDSPQHVFSKEEQAELEELLAKKAAAEAAAKKKAEEPDPLEKDEELDEDELEDDSLEGGEDDEDGDPLDELE